MLICVLSDDYFTNSNAVFELESGVQVGLHTHQADLFLVCIVSVVIRPDGLLHVRQVKIH